LQSLTLTKVVMLLGCLPVFGMWIISLNLRKGGGVLNLEVAMIV